MLEDMKYLKRKDHYNYEILYRFRSKGCSFISFIKFVIGGIYNGICSIIYWLLGYNSKFIIDKKIRWGLFMDWEKGCYNGNYFDLVEEKEDRYICKCEFCDNEFTKWKQEEKEED